MSLLKRRSMSDKQRAASRANGRRSHGAATSGGRGQIRAANLRHGLFSQAQDIVLPTLGEDAKEYEKLRQGCSQHWPHADSAELDRLAAATWRLERADCRLEELEVQIIQPSAGQATGVRDAFLRAMTIQVCAFRDFMQISNRLLRSSARRERALTGLPENVLKTNERGNQQGNNPRR